jgi:hypothetical protein
VKWLLAGLYFCFVNCGASIAAENSSSTEYQVKAAYLYNFTKFIDWPATNFTSADAPLVIGIIGEDPFGKTLDDLVKGENVRGHPLVVKRLEAGDDWRGCQVLFISQTEKNQMPALLQQLKSNPVLTVGDSSGFAEQGGMINFVIVQEKVKLEINPEAATEAGLQISSKLLKLARIVKIN